MTQVGGTERFTCDPLTLAAEYTGITCQDLTLNQLPTGTYQLIFNSDSDGATSLVANTFVITTPTTVTETVYEDVTASTTLSPVVSVDPRNARRLDSTSMLVTFAD